MKHWRARAPVARRAARAQRSRRTDQTRTLSSNRIVLGRALSLTDMVTLQPSEWPSHSGLDESGHQPHVISASLDSTYGALPSSRYEVPVLRGRHDAGVQVWVHADSAAPQESFAHALEKQGDAAFGHVRIADDQKLVQDAVRLSE